MNLAERNQPFIVGPCSVFRNGDWNMKSQGNPHTSLTHDQFADTKGKT